VSEKRETFEPGSGVHMIDWPGHNGGKRSSKRHCPICAKCTAMHCHYKTEDHVACKRHFEMADKWFDVETGRLK
jgi:hypothetical protein